MLGGSDCWNFAEQRAQQTLRQGIRSLQTYPSRLVWGPYFVLVPRYLDQTNSPFASSGSFVRSLPACLSEPVSKSIRERKRKEKNNEEKHHHYGTRHTPSPFNPISRHPFPPKTV
ncbi:hypothetical protein LY76DRAFT_349565 [Colletotrichum caudatum]|nr:hypothetical protein LY76DRAFT_349565 [Colletotrichum caudatum]